MKRMNIPFDVPDYTTDNIVDKADENVAPGVHFDIAYGMPKMNARGLLGLVFKDSMIANHWGAVLSTSAPIRGKNGEAIAILALDIVQ